MESLQKDFQAALCSRKNVVFGITEKVPSLFPGKPHFTFQTLYQQPLKTSEKPNLCYVAIPGSVGGCCSSKATMGGLMSSPVASRCCKPKEEQMQTMGGMFSNGQCRRGGEDLGLGKKECGIPWHQPWWPITSSCTI